MEPSFEKMSAAPWYADNLIYNCRESKPQTTYNDEVF